MKRGIKVTEKNMSAVMGRINKFFSRPTVIIEQAGATPVNGQCVENIHRKNFREAGEHMDSFNKTYCEDHLLQCVFDGGHAISVQRGSRVFISGSEMVIEHANAYARTYRPGYGTVVMPLMGHNTFNRFKHVDKDDAYNMELLKKNLHDCYEWASKEEYFMEQYINDLDSLDFMEMRSNLAEAVSHIIENVGSSDSVAERVNLLEGKAEVLIKMNISRNMEQCVPGKDSLCFSFNGESYETTGDLYRAILNYYDEDYLDDEDDYLEK